MTAESCEFVEVRGAWVLNALPPEEAAAFARHLDTCLGCQTELAATQPVADALLGAVPPATAPPSLEQRLMAEIRPAVARAPAPPRRRRWARVAVGAAAAVVLAVVTFGIGRSTAPDADRQVAERRLAVSETAARATLRERDGMTELVLEELGPPPRGEVYQLWLRRPREPLAATNRLFSVSDQGTAVVAVPRLRDAEELVVTAEPPQGSRSPSLPPVLVARL